jgi:DNA-directed RNA polymerase beta subunit
MQRPNSALKNSCREDINIVVAFRAMGMESDQEIVALVGAQPGLAPLLAPSLQEAKAAGILIRQQALEYIGARAAFSDACRVLPTIISIRVRQPAP